MSSYNNISAFKIYTGTSVTNAQLGLYAGVFRWIEYQANGLTEAWTAGIIDTISTIKIRADFSTGGNLVKHDGLTLTIRGTDQFILRCKQLGISLINLYAEYYEFIGTVADADADKLGGYLKFTGTTESPLWNIGKTDIRIESNDAKSNALLTKKINVTDYPYSDNVGEIIPVTFGNAMARYVRTVNKNDTLLNNHLPVNTCAPVVGIFPSQTLVFASDWYLTVYKLRVANSSTNSTSPFGDLAGMFVVVEKGKGIGPTSYSDGPDLSGVIKKIASIDTTLSSYNTGKALDVYVDSSYEANLVGRVVGDNNCWLSFRDIQELYACDLWNQYKLSSPKTRLDEGVTVSSKVITLDASGKSIGLIPEKFTVQGSSFKANDYHLFLCTSPAALADATMDGWFINDMVKKSDGVFTVAADAALLTPVSGQYVTGINNVSNGNPDDYCEIRADIITSVPSATIRFAIQLAVPTIPDDIDFTNVFLGLRAEVYHTRQGTVKIYCRDWAVDNVYLVYQQTFGDPGNMAYPIDVTINDLPSLYYPTITSDTNFYYLAANKLGGSYRYWSTGYKNFPVNVMTKKEDFRRMPDILVVFEAAPSQLPNSDRPIFRLYELGLLLTKEFSIGNKLYSEVGGRVFGTYPLGLFEPVINVWSSGSSPKTAINNTTSTPPASPATNDAYIVKPTATGAWAGHDEQFTYWNGSAWLFISPVTGNVAYVTALSAYVIFNGTSWGFTRKQPFSPISDPISVLEHACRLQDWSSLGATEVPGLEYSASARVRTGAVDGSFDSTQVSEQASLEVARQITSDGAAYSLDIKQTLCKEFFLCSYQDADGHECVKNIFSTAATTDLITFDRIIPGSFGAVDEPDQRYIFVNPMVQYGLDVITNKYAGTLSVTNAQRATFSSSYVSGFSGADGEDVWDKCHARYLKFRQDEKMSTTLSELRWIKTYAGALWYLNKLLDLTEMRRFNFSLPYSIGSTWLPGRRVDVQVPYHTNLVTVKGVIETIEYSKGKNAVKMQTLILDDLTGV